MQARERPLHPFELRGVALDHLEVLATAVQHARHRPHEQALLELDDVLERGPRPLRLHHPELDQVPARLALLGAERGAETVHAAERHGRGLHVELAALRQVALSSKYCVSNSVVVPSHALGVKIGASTSVKPSRSMKSRNAAMISARTRRMDCWRGDRSHRWR
jgi:hypothetical protein